MTTSPSTAQPEIDPTTIAPNTVVEVESYTTRRALYIRPDGYAYRYDGDAMPWDGSGWRITRVLADATPWPMISPSDVRVGMVVERRRGEAAFRDRVRSADVRIDVSVANLWKPVHATVGWSIWLIEDAPEPVDPDAELVERMAKEVHDRNCADVGCRDWDGHGESTRKAWWEDARVVIRNLRAQGFDVTARAEQ